MPSWISALWEPSARSYVKKVNRLEQSFRALSDSELAGKTAEFRSRLEKGEKLFSLLPEAFATVREASRRTIGLRHFDVQIQGGVELARGRIVEMKTGEGKTLVATLPSYLHALTGKGVHVITVNDYLAARDAEWMGKIHRFLGLQVGIIQESMGAHEASDIAARKAAYAADITYGTNSEMVFDYLRDNLAKRPEEVVHRGFYFAIVDEVDLLLIDEAQTPLIISGKGEEDPRFFEAVDRVVRTLKLDEHYKVDRKNRAASLLDEGLSRIEAALGVGSLSHPDNLRWMHATHQSVQAHGVYERDVDYIVEEGEVYIVDEHTGRVSEDKRFSDGLHQALEAKEHVRIKSEDVTLAKTSYQHYFRAYPVLSGMTGTAYSERDEFRKVYFKKVVVLPTHRPMIRKDYARVVFKSMEEKHQAVVQEIEENHEVGRPVLVGTVSVAESEQISRLLNKKNIQHEILNAKLHAREAEIIAQAGREKAVTISTNMAGRGTDIMLGGNAELLAAQEVPEDSDAYTETLRRHRERCKEEAARIAAAGGLAVIGTGEHESVRIDNQLRGRAGRQGDPGSSIYFVSLDDPVYRKFGNDIVLPELKEVLSESPYGQPVKNLTIERTLNSLRKKIEIENEAIRLDVLKYDTIVHERRETIWRWRRSLLEASEPEEWTRSVLDLFEDLLEGLEAQEALTPKEEDHQEENKPIAKWRNLLEKVMGVTLSFSENQEPKERDDAAQWLESAYRQRYGTEWDDGLRQWERYVLLDIIDRLWTQFLSDLERIEQGIGLRGYANMDPLVEFRKEAGALFVQFMLDIQTNAVRAWLSVDPRKLAEAKTEEHSPVRRGTPRSKAEEIEKRSRALDKLPKVSRGGRRKRKS